MGKVGGCLRLDSLAGQRLRRQPCAQQEPQKQRREPQKQRRGDRRSRRGGRWAAAPRAHRDWTRLGDGAGGGGGG
ncbi:hypothetical protein CDD83_8425 [Cordyceps sp. RAO-2017]|nr:hypothetical protein CDD83_8425 [Cordyceps sp. RAO-2017]